MTTRLLLALIITLASVGCAAPHVSVEPRYGRLDAQGDLALTSGGSPVAHNSLEDLDVSGVESAPGLRLDLAAGSPHLTLGTDSADWSGSGVVSDFGGISGANVAVDTELELAVHRGLVTFDLLPVPNVELGLGLGAEAVDLKASATDTLTTTQEKIDQVLPVPVLAARLGVKVWRLEFEALVAGMSIDIDGKQASYFDTDLSARIKVFDLGPVGWLFSAGYRRIDLAAEYDDSGDSVDADLTFDGIYLGLRIGI